MDQYYNIESLQKVNLGRQGENSALTVKINLQSWLSEYPNAQFYLVVVRPMEKTPYFAETTFSDGILSWVITSADLGISGSGMAEIQALEDSVVKKSKLFQTLIDACLPGTASPVPPIGAPSWVKEILDSRAENFEINRQTGHLLVHKVDGAPQDLGKVVPGPEDVQPVVEEEVQGLSLYMNPSTYEIQLQYNSHVLGTIDLPLESTIVSASESGGIITFVLQNGNTFTVSISDIVLGLVSESDFQLALQTLNAQLALKASQAALEAETAARQNGDTALGNLVDGKSTVTSGGQHIATFDADTKVDKITTGSGIRIPVTNASGNQGVLQASETADAGTAAIRGIGGVLKVGTPSASGDAATKGYVDGKVTDITTSLNGKANNDGFYEDMTVGRSLLANGLSSDRQIDNVAEACLPITFGTVGGNAEVQDGYSAFTELRGNTVLWNQLLANNDFSQPWGSPWSKYGYSSDDFKIEDGILKFTADNATDTSSNNNNTFQYFDRIGGHKYLMLAKVKLETAGDYFKISIGGGESYAMRSAPTTDWQIMAAIVTSPSTARAAFGMTDTRTSGWTEIQVDYVLLVDLTKLVVEYPTVEAFRKDYPGISYPQDLGTLKSAKSASCIIRGKNQCSGLNTFIRVLPNTEYELSGITDGSLEEYDANQNLVKTTSISATADITLTSETFYVKIQATTYTNVMFYIAFETYNEPYVAYESQTVTLPNLELRSLGNVYDVAYQTGGGKRRIGIRAYESGDESDPAVLTDGTNTIYVLAQETDISEVENPGWTELVKIDNYGTIEFTANPVQNPQIPQAYFIRYTVNLTEFLDSAYVRANGDANSILTESQIDTSIPSTPTDDRVPSTKLLSTIVGDINAVLDTINGVVV